MLQVGQTYSALPKILELLNPGDIVTHIFSPCRTACWMKGTAWCRRRSAPARWRGIRFDVGNGQTAHITWPIVDAATRDVF